MIKGNVWPRSMSTFWAWWMQELVGFLPYHWRMRQDTRSSFVLRLVDDTLEIHRRRQQRLTLLGTIRLPTISGEGGLAIVEPDDKRLVKILQEEQGHRVLVLEPECGLLCTDVLPVAAEANLGKIMPHRLEVSTPWPIEQIHIGHRVLKRQQDGMIEVLVAIIPRILVDPILVRLATYGIEVNAVDLLRRDGGGTLGINMIAGEAKTTGTSFWWRAGLATGILIFFALIGVGVWRLLDERNEFKERQQYAAALEQRLADLPELMRRVDQLDKKARFVADARQALPSPLIVIEVLSRALPESIWLDEFTLEDRTLTISGYAEDAAQVLPIIESSAVFSKAESRAPSIRVSVPGPGGGTREVERFSLSAQVDPASEFDP